MPPHAKICALEGLSRGMPVDHIRRKITKLKAIKADVGEI